METIGERIEHVLAKRGKKKSDMARDLGIATSSVSTMCSGRTNPSSQTITMICRTYGCNEQWLRTGKGDPFPPKTTKEELAEFFGILNQDNEESAAARELVEALSKMDRRYWVQFRDYCLEVAAAHEARKGK